MKIVRFRFNFELVSYKRQLEYYYSIRVLSWSSWPRKLCISIEKLIISVSCVLQLNRITKSNKYVLFIFLLLVGQIKVVKELDA